MDNKEHRASWNTHKLMLRAIDAAEFVAVDEGLDIAVIWWGSATLAVYNATTWECLESMTIDDENGKVPEKQAVRIRARDVIRCARMSDAGFDPEKRVVDMSEAECEAFKTYLATA